MTEENQIPESVTTIAEDFATEAAAATTPAPDSQIPETSQGEPTAESAPTSEAPATTSEAIPENPTQPVADAPAPATDSPPAPSGAPSASAAITPEPEAEAAAPEDGELQRLLTNGLHIFGKVEHWTAGEIAAFAAWLESRLP